jgi:hypothetical protein
VNESLRVELWVKIFKTITLILGLALIAGAQEPMQHDHAAMQMDHATMQMTTTGGEFASGTSWLPLSSPQYMWMTAYKGWNFMFHGELILGYDQQGGSRGVGKAFSSNWLMMMQQHKVGKGTIEFREMLSAEPLTIPRPGLPTLFQTGETYKGQPLVDYQHPHDVFDELAFRYSYPLSERAAWYFYGAAVGEPALGPTAFMHRPSAAENPAPPLGHHLQDSTHVAFGVVTTGITVGPVKLEGSVFNGREPDETRYNFDFGPLDSFSGRVTVAPTRNWAVQYSYGHLVEPEALEPGNLNRQTASITYNRPFARGYWANSLIWGRNHKTFEDRVENSYLYETTFNFADKNYLYSRLELVDKDELDLAPPLNDQSFRIGSYSFGGVRDLVHNKHGQIGLGAGVTFYSKPASLDPVYGNNPVSFSIFLRLRPGLMKH